MNREDIIRMAREAGWDAHHAEFDTRIERFASLVMSAECDRLTNFAIQAAEKSVDMAITLEREACAKIAETPIGEYDVIVVCGGDPTIPKIPMYLTNKDVAKAIRARGQA